MKNGFFKEVDLALVNFDTKLKKILHAIAKNPQEFKGLKEDDKGEMQAKEMILYLKLKNKSVVNKLLKEHKRDTAGEKGTSSVDALMYIVEKGDLNLIFDTNKLKNTDTAELDNVEDPEYLHPHFF